MIVQVCSAHLGNIDIHRWIVNVYMKTSAKKYSEGLSLLRDVLSKQPRINNGLLSLRRPDIDNVITYVQHHWSHLVNVDRMLKYMDTMAVLDEGYTLAESQWLYSTCRGWMGSMQQRLLWKRF